MHPVLLTALQDPSTPPEVRAVIIDLQALDPVDAALEARLFARALRAEDVLPEGRVSQRRALRQAFRDWKSTLKYERQVMSGERLAQVCTEWSDQTLAEVI